MRTTIDGQSDSGGVVKAGVSRRIAARREVLLRVGDAGAVTVSVNGGSPAPVGRAGEVVTRRFTLPVATSGAPPPANGRAAEPSVVPPVSKPQAGLAEIPPGIGDELTNAAGRWLDAYYRDDAATMASLAPAKMTVTDQRPLSGRLPSGLSNVRRTLERVSFQFTGNTAILSGRMTEQAEVGGQPREVVSWISQVWLRESGQWRLAEVRLLDNARLK